jgi:3-phenylpropionate/trans-cinnamate dioxygenase ferredoxin subunit
MPVSIKVRLNGPYLVDLTQDTVVITDHEGNVIPLPEGKTSITLCRCGASTRKPFCDGQHSKVGFVAAEAAQKMADAAGVPLP